MNRPSQIPAEDHLPLHTRVARILTEDYQIPAAVEYPGAVSIRFAPTEQVWTGLTGWDYGSVSVLDVENDCWEPTDDSIDLHQPAGWLEDVLERQDAAALAEAWAAVVAQRIFGRRAAGEALSGIRTAHNYLARACSAWTSTEDQSDVDAYLDGGYPFAMSLDEQVAAIQVWIERIERRLGA